MSNETDLDWLALNVHVWNESAYAAMCGGVERALWISGAAYGQKAEFKNAVTKDQWLARRAELQNKPSFADHPDAKCLFQHESGVWSKNIESHDMGIDAIGWRNEYQSLRADYGWLDVGKGEVLGDWRDTLEKRPEEFKPFASIEDNQELSMTQQQVKQDNGWFERGELPPVGIECEAKKYGKEEYYKVVICGAGKHLGLAVSFYEKQKGSGAFTCSSAEYFRPIRTEREVAIEEMQSDIAERWANCEELAKYLVDKGWVKAGK